MKKLQKMELLEDLLVVQILSRLPARSLLRFRSVSKQWRANIDDDHFRNLHAQQQRSPRSSSSPDILLCSTQCTTEPPTHEQPLLAMWRHGSSSLRVINHEAYEDYWIIEYAPSNTCNGLICLVPFPLHTVDIPESSILVSNPLLNEYIKLPSCTTSSGIRCTAGLGFAPVSKEYKVVCITTANQRHPTEEKGELKVYTLGSDKSWRSVQQQQQQCGEFKPRLWKDDSPVYLDGKIYWLIWVPELAHRSLMSFDVETEQASVLVGAPDTITETRQPSSIIGTPITNYQLVVLGCRRVSLFVNHGLLVHIWVLVTDDNVGGQQQWNLRYKIKAPDTMYTPIEKLVGVLELRDGSLLIFLEGFIMHFHGKIASVVGQVSDFCVYINDGSRSIIETNWYMCRGYKSSLVSLRKFGSRSWETFPQGRSQELLPPPDIHLLSLDL